MRKKNPLFRQALKERHGTKCYVCGETPVEYHHLIPLWLGGEDTLENRIALCHYHHMQIHGAAGKRWYSGGGRPLKPIPRDYESVLDSYFSCKIGLKRCRETLSLGSKTHLSDKSWYKDYIIKHGISKHRNNVDTLFKKHNGDMKGIPLDREIGYVRYQDGKTDVYSVGDVEIW